MLMKLRASLVKRYLPSTPINCPVGRVSCLQTSLDKHGKYRAGGRYRSFHHWGRLDCGCCVRDDAAESIWISQVGCYPRFPPGSHHHFDTGVFPSQPGDATTVRRDKDSGRFVHRPVRAPGRGECGLPGSALHAAALPFPGAGVCQGLKNTLELVTVRVGTGITSLMYTT